MSSESSSDSPSLSVRTAMDPKVSVLFLLAGLLLRCRLMVRLLVDVSFLLTASISGWIACSEFASDSPSLSVRTTKDVILGVPSVLSLLVTWLVGSICRGAVRLPPLLGDRLPDFLTEPPMDERLLSPLFRLSPDDTLDIPSELLRRMLELHVLCELDRPSSLWHLLRCDLLTRHPELLFRRGDRAPSALPRLRCPEP